MKVFSRKKPVRVEAVFLIAAKRDGVQPVVCADGHVWLITQKAPVEGPMGLDNADALWITLDSGWHMRVVLWLVSVRECPFKDQVVVETDKQSRLVR